MQNTKKFGHKMDKFVRDVNAPPVPPDAPKSRKARQAQVKNKSAAPVQITAEQLLREANEFKEMPFEKTRQQITDPEELNEHRLVKRREFETVVRRQKMNIGVWTKYAQWEANQKEFDRARSIFERALDVDYRNSTLWLKYAEMEMASRFVNHARNVWNRAVAILPRVDQFWYKYAHMEEMLGNVAGARQVFDRWLEWQPDPNAWVSSIKFEMRHHNVEGARMIYEKFLVIHNEVSTYLKYAKFESKHGSKPRSRLIYERAIDELGEEANNEELFIAFAKFEEMNQEYERARALFKYALDHIPKHRAEELYKTYTQFEKQRGDRQGVEDVILSKRRFQYEEELKTNPHNYDTWFDYVRLEEAKGEIPRVREVYERAIAQIPPAADKKFWRRYIYLWIYFAMYEELVAKDITRTRQVYEKCLEMIPHKKFTFAKIWLMFAHFEIRQKNLDAARKVLGRGLGECIKKDKIYKGYIEFESQLVEFERCRKLYEGYLRYNPSNCNAWKMFAEMEANAQEFERTRGIYELAIEQEVLDMPEVIWKSYIDFEISQENHDNVRQLYDRLISRTKHVKVWISRAQFEASISEAGKARSIYAEADQHLKDQATSGAENAKEERMLLLDSWREFEEAHGTEEQAKTVQAKLPRRVRKRRPVTGADGAESGWEEYHDYIFPDEEDKQANLKLLEMARRWKKQKTSDDVMEET